MNQRLNKTWLVHRSLIQIMDFAFEEQNTPNRSYNEDVYFWVSIVGANLSCYVNNGSPQCL